MRSFVGAPIALWESMQVELHGSYSAARVLELAEYESLTGWSHEILVLVGTPLPCLVVTLLVDLLPLGNPSDGVGANKMFFLRQYYIFVVMTFFTIHQFRVGVRALPFPVARAHGYSIAFSAFTVGITYGLIGAIGFPLPFTILSVSPMWLVLTSTAMVIEWRNKMRENPPAAKVVTDMVKLWLCDILLAFIYPLYFYIFTTLSSDGQTAFSLVLPVIKLCMRNLIARMAEHLKDETPEIVVFNAELFNSLFVSYCMQSSPSFTTTLLIMIANVVTMVFSLRDIERSRCGLKTIEHRIDEEWQQSSLRGRTIANFSGGRRLTTLQRASNLLQQEKNQTNARVATPAEIIHMASYHDITNGDIERKKNTLAPKPASFTVMPKKLFPNSSRPLRYLGQSQREAIVHPTVDETKPVENDLSTVPHTVIYTCKVQRLLYMAEFLILLKYVEVVIPLVFSIYLIATYQMPNRAYYAVFDGMDQSLLIQTLGHVMFYCSLQLVSLLFLIAKLQCMLGIRPTRQLAFVLDKQFHWVQTSLIVWVLYNSQASLQHCGYDYTFRFAWLRTPTHSSRNE